MKPYVRTGRLPGRPKGVPNGTNKSVKESILKTFLGTGGVKEMKKWARENRTDFYTKILTKLVPTDVTTDGNKIEIFVKRATDEVKKDECSK